MHAIAFGKRLFGRVDSVAGRYHVATLCWHFCYLPLLPLGTFLILKSTMRGMTTHFEGVRLPFSAKSLLFAWVRPPLILCFSVMLVTSGTSLAVVLRDHLDLLAWGKISGVTLAGAALLFGPYLIPGLGRATKARAAELARFAATPARNYAIETGHA